MKNSRGGGLMIGVKDNIPYRNIKINMREQGDDITESATIEVPQANH